MPVTEREPTVASVAELGGPLFRGDRLDGQDRVKDARVWSRSARSAGAWRRSASFDSASPRFTAPITVVAASARRPPARQTPSTISAMDKRRAGSRRAVGGGAAVGVFAALLILSAGVGASGAATPAENAAFAKQLKADIKPVFTKQAPGLVLGKVTCTLPASGTVVHCVAHFADLGAQADVVYGIRATIKESATKTTIDWATTTHYCTSVITHKRLSC
jgi:hypothetical protein